MAAVKAVRAAAETALRAETEATVRAVHRQTAMAVREAVPRIPRAAFQALRRAAAMMLKTVPAALLRKPQHSFPFFHIAGTFTSCGTPGPFSLLHSSLGIFTHTSLTKINEKAIIIKRKLYRHLC